MTPYHALLKSYCDTIVRTQITMPDPYFYGGVPCPACHLLHGRIVDIVYPMSLMYHLTGEEKYLTCAKAAVAFAEHNLTRDRGGYYNDAGAAWTGPTVFAAIAFGEALLYHGEALDEATRAEWERIHLRITEYVRVRFTEEDFHANINYFASYVSAMAVAYRLYGEEKHKEAAYKMAAHVRSRFTDDGLLLGEGTHVPTPKVLYAVDMGYNVEESLPSLTAFAYYMKDEEWMAFVTDAWRAHIGFMLPDGAWDNSFGTRHYKWTYYGSRTSDGAGVGLAYIWDKDPLFAEAAERNFRLLSACSEEGYLYGGAMYKEAGEAPCVHHTFTHAKAIAAMIDHGFAHGEATPLPRDTAYGLRHYKDMNVSLVAVGDYRATVSGYDYVARREAATGGGTLTMLYHMKYGPVFAATMASYERFEQLNMQLSRHADVIRSATVRIEKDGFSSPYALDAVFTSEEKDGIVTATAQGRLQDKRGKVTGADYTLSYRFTEEEIRVTALSAEDATLHLPVICGKDGAVRTAAGDACISRENATVSLHSDENFTYNDKTDRLFNPVGGFLSADLTLPLKAGKAVTVTIAVK